MPQQITTNSKLCDEETSLSWGWRGGAQWSVLHRITQNHFYGSKICGYSVDPNIGHSKSGIIRNPDFLKVSLANLDHWKSGLFEGWFAKWLAIQKTDISVRYLNGKTKWQPFWPKPFENWKFIVRFSNGKTNWLPFRPKPFENWTIWEPT